MKARRMVVGRRDDWFESNSESADEKVQSRMQHRGTTSRLKTRMESVFRGILEAGEEDFPNLCPYSD
jgi:hypothetical protein